MTPTKQKKNGPSLENTHHLACIFVFFTSYHLQPPGRCASCSTFAHLWGIVTTGMADRCGSAFFLGHQQLDGQRKTLRKNGSLSPLTSPLSINLRNNTPFFVCRLYKSFLWTWCFFFRHLFIGHPNKPKGSQLSTLPQETLSPDEAEALMSAIDAWRVKGILPRKHREIFGKSLAIHFFKRLVYESTFFYKGLSSLQTEQPIFHNMMVNFKGN